GGLRERRDEEQAEKRNTIHGTKLRNLAFSGNENLRTGVGQHCDCHVVWEGAWLGVRLAEEICLCQHPIVLEVEGAHAIELAAPEVEHVAIDGPAHGSHADVCEVER